jgi:anti-sigma regulatory factor (Ser/Thr protein kinase)
MPDNPPPVTASTPDCANFELQLDAEPPSVTRARTEMAAVARCAGASVDDVKVAVSEAVGNSVLHAYRDTPPGTITISAHCNDVLEITVADDGAGMSPNVDSPGLGIGISLITQAAQDVQFGSSSSGTTVTMTFSLGARADKERG